MDRKIEKSSSLLSICLLVVSLSNVACRSSSGESTASGGSSGVSTQQQGSPGSSLLLGPVEDRAPGRVGMVYIPPGALVVGTPSQKRPRRADREVAGEQVMLQGFYIDRFGYPNEEGAIPMTNVSAEEARVLCETQEKRLCTELEWERACKGPDNRTFEYGEEHDAEVCRTGRRAALRPSGYFGGCQSDFGVRDLHGGPFEWTKSLYRRGTTRGEVVIKGGNGVPGEVIGRCANVESRAPTTKEGGLGFRCCAGDTTELPIELEYRFPPALIPRVRFEEAIEKAILASLPAEVAAELAKIGSVRRERVWLWRPIANEELYLVALCARSGATIGPACGLLVTRVVSGGVVTLAWVSSGKWVANLHKPGPLTHLWLLGGDERGSFKRLVEYAYGDVKVGELTFAREKGH